MVSLLDFVIVAVVSLLNKRPLRFANKPLLFRITTDLLVAVRTLVSVRTSNESKIGSGGTGIDTGRSLRIKVRAGDPDSRVFVIEDFEAEIFVRVFEGEVVGIVVAVNGLFF